MPLVARCIPAPHSVGQSPPARRTSSLSDRAGHGDGALLVVGVRRANSYYLGIQTDISAEFDPPYLGHQALVEGIVSDEPRICGGVVLKPVTRLAASGARSVVQHHSPGCRPVHGAVRAAAAGAERRRAGLPGTTPAPPARPSPPSEPREFALHYDFDNGVMGRHAGVLGQILNQARASKATRVRITGYRGATRLSDGRVMAERPDIGARRAREIADLLREAGLTGVAFEVSSQGEPEAADGIDDWRSRRTTVRVEP